MLLAGSGVTLSPPSTGLFSCCDHERSEFRPTDGRGSQFFENRVRRQATKLADVLLFGFAVGRHSTDNDGSLNWCQIHVGR